MNKLGTVWSIVALAIYRPYCHFLFGKEKPLERLKRRCAKGEINKDQLEQMKKDSAY